MTTPSPTDIGPFAGDEDEPVPSAAMLAPSALAMYWAGLYAIGVLYDVLEEIDGGSVDNLSDDVRYAIGRLQRAVAPVRMAAINSRSAQMLAGTQAQEATP